MIGKRLAAYTIVVALAGGLVTFYVRAVRSTRGVEANACRAMEPETQDTPAPGFTLTDLAGKKQSLSDHKGKAVLLHFWFTDCPPCLEELPSLLRMQSQLVGRKDFTLLTVSVDDSASKVKEFIAKNHVAGLSILHDAERRVPARYGTEKFPESYLIDREGRIRYRFVNQRNWTSAPALACIQSVLN
ncbi:MAG: TlpA family protein disulfide reductase [Deltaproteobacteria bacterium]|nr:TlpA family protein disulfide reductase [Deltaproteobacteria bacterium]